MIFGIDFNIIKKDNKISKFSEMFVKIAHTLHTHHKIIIIHPVVSRKVPIGALDYLRARELIEPHKVGMTATRWEA